MRFSILSATSLLLAAAPVLAAKPKPTPPPAPAAQAPDPSKLEAKQLTQAANQDYTLGRFEEALDKYSRAYEKFKAPELLFNIGQCHKNLHEKDRAVFFFQGFLRAKPDAQNRKLVEDMIVELKAEIARDEQAAREKERLEQQRLLMAQNDDTTPPGLRAGKSPETPVYKKPWFWVVIGTGVAVVAGGVATAVYFGTQAPARVPTQGNVDLR